MAPEQNELTLRAAASRLGVHYMTAYRYVRLGRLPATKRDGLWRVDAADVEALRAPTGPPIPARRRLDPVRLADRLVAGDEPGAWAVLEAALVGGATPTELHVRLVGPAMREIGDRWEAGTLTVGGEHRATAVTLRLLGRLSPMFRPRGRTRGTVVVAAAPGDSHAIPGALVADALRAAHFHVVELGGDTPAADVVGAGIDAESLVAVCLSFALADLDESVAETVSTVRDALHVPVFVGGPACAGPEHAERLGADGTAPDALGAVALLTG